MLEGERLSQSASYYLYCHGKSMLDSFTTVGTSECFLFSFDAFVCLRCSLRTEEDQRKKKASNEPPRSNSSEKSPHISRDMYTGFRVRINCTFDSIDLYEDRT
ncbi:unnamed protein product [Periconia digitata]|uniref:Uncharacterized protein n=1 Tax=Periconia digitata TaxID=1303443 RepID=A0A9W4US22_9PLEO|nr:unnamed protein product [Periconia digitata]